MLLCYIMTHYIISYSYMAPAEAAQTDCGRQKHAGGGAREEDEARLNLHSAAS